MPEELRAGRHDLVIATRRPTGGGLVAEPSVDEEFVLVAAPVWAEREGCTAPGRAAPWLTASGPGQY